MSTQFTATASPVTLLSTQLNSLADGANKITTTPIPNATGLDLFANFIFDLAAQASARDANAVIHLYLIPEVDGVYAYGGDTLDPASKHYVGSFEFDAATAARKDVLEGVALPNSDCHALITNATGQPLASTDNTLRTAIYEGYEDE